MMALLMAGDAASPAASTSRRDVWIARPSTVRPTFGRLGEASIPSASQPQQASARLSASPAHTCHSSAPARRSLRPAPPPPPSPNVAQSVDVHAADAPHPRREVAASAGARSPAAPAVPPGPVRRLGRVASSLLRAHLPVWAADRQNAKRGSAGRLVRARKDRRAGGAHESPNMSIRSPPSANPALRPARVLAGGGALRGACPPIAGRPSRSNRPPPPPPPALPPPMRAPSAVWPGALLCAGAGAGGACRRGAAAAAGWWSATEIGRPSAICLSNVLMASCAAAYSSNWSRTWRGRRARGRQYGVREQRWAACVTRTETVSLSAGVLLAAMMTPNCSKVV